MPDEILIALSACAEQLLIALRFTRDRESKRLPVFASPELVNQGIEALYKSFVNADYPGLVE